MHWEYTKNSKNFIESNYVATLSILFILVINQLDAQNLLYNKFISCLYMFRAPCAHRLWYHHTYRCDDTRGCIIQF